MSVPVVGVPVVGVSVFLCVAIAMAPTVSMVAVSGRMAWGSHRY